MHFICCSNVSSLLPCSFMTLFTLYVSVSNSNTRALHSVKRLSCLYSRSPTFLFAVSILSVIFISEDLTVSLICFILSFTAFRLAYTDLFLSYILCKLLLNSPGNACKFLLTSSYLLLFFSCTDCHPFYFLHEILLTNYLTYFVYLLYVILSF